MQKKKDFRHSVAKIKYANSFTQNKVAPPPLTRHEKNVGPLSKSEKIIALPRLRVKKYYPQPRPPPSDINSVASLKL